MNPPFPKSYWLEPERVLCGEYPRDFDDLGDHEGMTALLNAGVRCFVDLTEEGELKPYREIAIEAARRIGIDPGVLEFHPHPIRDVSIPRSANEMRATLRTVRVARHAGRIVYIHCWGGRGRTGTVAGCLLSDLFGLSGEAALVALSDRWQACAKSARWDSPETDEQRHFVCDWQAKAGTSRICRIRSAILGAAIGDALGVPVEFQARSVRRDDPVTGMLAYGTHQQPAGTWSDDTSMILATITGLVQAGRFEAEPIMEEFRAWVAEARHTPHGAVFDIGNATRSAIRRFEQGTPASECGGTGENSNGNGSLMRILPISLAYGDDPDLMRKASDISSLTHAHERSRFCCAFYCLVVSDLLHGSSIAEATDFAWQVMDACWEFSPQERPRFEALRPDRLFAREEVQIASSGHVIDTLEAALWVNARHANYADAVLHAVNLGDDTDTTGCVAGGLAGIIHGEKGIPDDWLELLVKKDELDSQIDEFAVLSKNESRSILLESSEP